MSVVSDATGAAFKDSWTLDDANAEWHGQIAEPHPACTGSSPLRMPRAPRGKPRIRRGPGGVTLAVRHRTDILSRTDQDDLPPPRKSHAQRLYGERDEVRAADETHVPFCVMQVHHWIPQAKGGGDQYQNVRVLCSGCNAPKGMGTPSCGRTEPSKSEHSYRLG